MPLLARPRTLLARNRSPKKRRNRSPVHSQPALPALFIIEPTVSSVLDWDNALKAPEGLGKYFEILACLDEIDFGLEDTERKFDWDGRFSERVVATERSWIFLPTSVPQRDLLSNFSL